MRVMRVTIDGLVDEPIVIDIPVSPDGLQWPDSADEVGKLIRDALTVLASDVR